MEEEEPIQENKETMIKKHRNKYSVAFKLKVVQLLKKGFSLHLLETKLNIDRHTIRSWKDNEENLLKVRLKDKKYRKNRIAPPIKTFNDEQEENICNFIKEAREKHKAISTKTIVCYASQINANFSKNTNFAKLNWCYHFLKHHGFSIHRVSHIGQNIPSNMQDMKQTFINEVIMKKKTIYST